MEVLLSRDYQAFGFNKKNNRAISKSNIKRLKKSILSIGITNPIIVDENLNILDGQHRFMALSELNKSVPYIINRSLTPESVSELNNISKSWSLWDYIYSYSSSIDDFEKLRLSVVKYKRLGISTVCVLFSESTSARTQITKDIKSGLFRFKDNSQVADYIVSLREDHLSMPTNTAIAIRDIISDFSYFDKDRLSTMIKRGKRIPNFQTVKECRKYIADFYNFRLRNEYKIF